MIKTIKRYVPYVVKHGLRYYFLSSRDRWSCNFHDIKPDDISESKIEIDMSKYPEMGEKCDYQELDIQITPNYL